MNSVWNSQFIFRGGSESLLFLQIRLEELEIISKGDQLNVTNV